MTRIIANHCQEKHDIVYYVAKECPLCKEKEESKKWQDIAERKDDECERLQEDICRIQNDIYMNADNEFREQDD